MTIWVGTDCADRVRYFLDTAATLGPKLGALLFQLPPYLRRDLASCWMLWLPSVNDSPVPTRRSVE
jgi:uncharacterized protein YecE (DUF72 family)